MGVCEVSLLIYAYLRKLHFEMHLPNIRGRSGARWSLGYPFKSLFATSKWQSVTLDLQLVTTFAQYRKVTSEFVNKEGLGCHLTAFYQIAKI